MKTIRGKQAILRSTAHLTGLFGQAIAVGIGNSAESVNSTALDHEVFRTAVTFVGVDEENSLIIFKATLPDYLAAKYSEAALFSTLTDSQAGAFSSTSIFSVSDAEDWSLGSNAAFETVNNRVEGRTVTLRPTASTTAVSGLSVNRDFSGYSASDTFNLSFTSDNANTSIVAVRFYTDSTNYYSLNFTPVGAGTRVATATKGSATATGTPNWAQITLVEVRATATAGGTAGVSFDSLRIEDVDTLSAEHTMVDRKVFSTVTKVAGRPQDIEYAFEVTL